jgi:metal-responsive CopG/Arc/MetJ family transcriptional regulator
MPDEFLNNIDQVAENEQRSRSELIREALRTYVNRQKVRNIASASKNAALLDAIL